jgi:hypothetical protein
MSYNNFIPTVWSEKIQRERERQVVAAKLCWREFEGEIKSKGSVVKINGVGRPTIGQYTKNSTVITPENLNDQSTNLVIDRADYFAFEIDDIDKRQSAGDLMNAQMAEAAAAMAESMDDYIYGKYAEAGETIDCSSITSATVLSKVSDGLKVLWSNKVPANEQIYLEVSPGFLQKILLAKILYAQPNDRTVDKGFEGMLLGCKVYLANGVYNDGTYDYCFLRTKKAIALADQFNEVEAYRPESSFSDAVKGLHLYGAKVIRPKELVVLKATYGAESAI